MQERQEQLFKAYDTLTEKIFLFERECDSLRTRKRQLIMLESRVHQTVTEQFESLQKTIEKTMSSKPMHVSNQHHVTLNVGTQNM